MEQPLGYEIYYWNVDVHPLCQSVRKPEVGQYRTRPSFKLSLCVGINRRIILFKYLLIQTIILYDASTIGWHYFLLNVV